MRYRSLLLALLLLAVGAPVSGQARSSPHAVHPRACYSHAPAHLPGNRWPAAQQQLAPPGAVTVRLCRYAGLNARPRLKLLRSSLHKNARLVAKLVREFDKLPPPPPGPTACPMDDGSQIIALLAYPNGHAARISVGLRGCMTVTNGDVVRTASRSRLVAELKRLT